MGEEDASRGARATRTRRLTRRARFVLTERCRRFGNDALHVAGKKKTRLRRRNASRGWVGGRRRAVVGPPARGGERGGDVPGRNTCAISRHLSSARSNGRNDLPRPRRIWTRRLCFVFAPKSANSSERKPACSTFIPFPGERVRRAHWRGGECEGTWLCFCFFTIAGRPKKESPYGHFGGGGDDLGELGAARPAERPKFRPDFGLGDPAMCVKLVPKVRFPSNFFRV